MKQSKKLKLKNNKTLRTWIASYIIMFTIPLLAGAFGVYESYRQSMEKEIHSLHQQTLEQTQTAVEHMLQSAVNTASALSLDNQVQTLSVYRNHNNLSPSQSITSGTLQDLIEIYATSNEYIQKIHLYFPETRYLMTADQFRSIDIFHSTEISTLGMTTEEFLSLTDRSNNGFHLIGGRPLYSYAVPLNTGAGSSVLVAIYLDQSFLADLFQGEDSRLFLECSDGSFFPSEGDAVTREWILQQGNQKHTTLLTLESERYSTRYYTLYQDTDSRGAPTLLLLLGLYVPIGAVIGALLAIYLSRKNYRPVADLLTLVAKDSKSTPQDGSDFSIIRSSYQALLEAYQDNKRTMKEWQTDRVNAWLNSLFKEKNKPALEIFRENALWSEAMKEDAFILMSVEITDFGHLGSNSPEEHSDISSDVVDMSYFIVKNCLEELLNQHYTSFSGETDGRIYALINLHQSMTLSTINQCLTQCASDLQSFIQTHYGMLLSINISGLHTSVAHISDAYQDIENLLLYRSYTNATEESVISHLEVSDDPEKHIIAKGYANQLYTILVHKDQNGLQEFVYHLTTQNVLFDQPSGAAVTESQKIGDVIEQISGYIQENYRNPMLSVGTIADEFRIGLSLLSRSYKEQKGIGILESINRLRLEHAKELIVSGVSIKDAAEQVGFYSTQPLIRIFKQIEHMTPSEYRNMHIQENNSLSL